MSWAVTLLQPYQLAFLYSRKKQKLSLQNCQINDILKHCKQFQLHPPI